MQLSSVCGSGSDPGGRQILIEATHDHPRARRVRLAHRGGPLEPEAVESCGTPQNGRALWPLLLAAWLWITLISNQPARADGAAALRGYNAFDLASPRAITVLSTGASTAITSGQVFQNNNYLACTVRLDTARKRLEVVPDKLQCPIYSQRTPAKFTVVATPGAPVDCKTDAQKQQPECAAFIPIEFDDGEVVTGTYDGNRLTVAGRLLNEVGAAAPKDACIASYSGTAWEQINVTFQVTGSMAVLSPLSLTAKAGMVYLRLGTCSTQMEPVRVLKIVYKSEQAKPGSPYPLIIEGQKHLVPKEIYPNVKNPWRLYVDQANQRSIPQIVYNPNNYVNPNSFGRVQVRHWNNVIPVLSTTGSGIALTSPTLEGGAGVVDTSTIGSSIVSTDGDAVTSEFLVSPHAPGALHLSIKFFDPSASDPSKPKTEIGADLLVDKGYSGALRFGVAHIRKTGDSTFTTIQRSPDGPFEISRNSAEGNEIVLGYSLYLDGFSVGGRRYFLLDEGWRALLARHLGIYAGFGAITYAKDNFDFLKSFHLGLEFEFSRNLSIAFTAVTRRTTELADGFEVGGFAPSAAVPTRSSLGLGYGIVLNFSTDFLQFVKGQVK